MLKEIQIFLIVCEVVGRTVGAHLANLCNSHAKKPTNNSKPSCSFFSFSPSISLFFMCLPFPPSAQEWPHISQHSKKGTPSSCMVVRLLRCRRPVLSSSLILDLLQSARTFSAALAREGEPVWSRDYR